MERTDLCLWKERIISEYKIPRVFLGSPLWEEHIDFEDIYISTARDELIFPRSKVIIMGFYSLYGK